MECGLWQPEDDVAAEHLKASPHCHKAQLEARLQLNKHLDETFHGAVTEEPMDVDALVDHIGKALDAIL